MSHLGGRETTWFTGMGTKHTESEYLARYKSAKCIWTFLFAETTGRGPAFLDMLEQFLEPRLLADGIPDTVRFQQDWAPWHYAIAVLDYLDRLFPGRWIGRGGTQPWAARSSDLTLNIPSLARQRCLSSWDPRRTPWFFCNFSTVWCGRLLKLRFLVFWKQ